MPEYDIIDMTTTNYCSNCGNKIEQNGIKASFCSKCGQDLRTLKKTVASVNEVEEIDEEGAPSTLDLSALEGKIKIYAEVEKPKVITVGDVISQAKASGKQEEQLSKREAANLPSGKDLLKTIAKECSSSKDKSAEVE